MACHGINEVRNLLGLQSPNVLPCRKPSAPRLDRCAGLFYGSIDLSFGVSLSNGLTLVVQPFAARHTNPVSLVRYPAVVLTRKAMAKLEEMLA